MISRNVELYQTGFNKQKAFVISEFKTAQITEAYHPLNKARATILKRAINFLLF